RTGEDFDFHDLNANSTQALQEMIEIRNNYEDEFNKLVESFDVSQQEVQQINEKMLEAINDPNIDVEAWMNWALALLEGADSARELREAIDEILDAPLSDFSRHAADEVGNLSDAMSDLGVSTRSSMDAAQAAMDEYRETVAEAATALFELA